LCCYRTSSAYVRAWVPARGYYLCCGRAGKMMGNMGCQCAGGMIRLLQCLRIFPAAIRQTAHCEPKHPLPLHITIGTRPYSSYFQCGLCCGVSSLSGAKPAGRQIDAMAMAAWLPTRTLSTVCFMASALWETFLAAFQRRGALCNWQK
jgi:hypothetical protein